MTPYPALDVLWPTRQLLPLQEPGAGLFLESERLEPLPSLYELKDVEFAVYRHEGLWRLHVAAGLQVRLNGRVTGGAALRTGDVIEGALTVRFLGAAWPGPRDPRLDERTLVAADDDDLALVYRDWLLEHDSPLSEVLRRPVLRVEQVRHLWALAPRIALGLVDVQFAGPFVRRVVTREPQLELTGFVEALERAGPEHPHFVAVRTLGLSPDDGVQLALLLSRSSALSGLAVLETGGRGAWQLEDFRRRDEALATGPEPGRLPELRSPREGLARAVTLEVTAWDGAHRVQPLTDDGRMVLDRDTGLVLADSGATLSPSVPSEVEFLRLADWALRVRGPGTREGPRRDGLPITDTIGLDIGDVLELRPGLSVRLASWRSRQ